MKMFGILWFLLLWLLQAHSGGLEENNDGWRFLLMAMMEKMRAGGETGGESSRVKPETRCL